MDKFKFLKKKRVERLPRETGVYAFSDKKEVLYIGKAINIRERVKNHLQKANYKDGLFVDRTTKIGYIKTNSEIEAFILEANLIKKYESKYNVVWRDDKNFFYVGKTKEKFPEIFITHQPKLKEKADYIGPFVDGKALKQTLKFLRKIFPFRSCKKIPAKPCLWYQLDRCPAPCLLKSNTAKEIPSFAEKMKKICQKNAKNLFELMRGEKGRVLGNLKREMKKAAKEQKFEEAAKKRDQIKSLEKIMAYAKVFEFQPKKEINWQGTEKVLQKLLKINKRIGRIEAYDISNIQGKEATGSMVVFKNGLPDKNSYRKFKIKTKKGPNDTAMIKEVLSRRLKHSEWTYPELILIDGGKGQLNAAKSCLTLKFKDIIVLALAKKKNELFIERRKKPILLKSLAREIFNLILQLRDEAHRFAISYHRKLRESSILS